MNRPPLTFACWLKIILAYAAVAAVVALVAPWFGYVKIEPAVILRELRGVAAASLQSEIFWQQRVPRVLLACCVGGALGLAGAVFQVLLRNPLATPDTLGVTSAGTLTAAVTLVFPSLSFAIGPFSSTYVCALAGSAIAAVFIFLLARRGHALSVPFLLLAGVSVNLFCGAAIMLMRFIADPYHLVAVDRWMMGGLTTVGYTEILALLPIIAIGAGLLLWQAHALNQLAFGNELAGGRGVHLQRVLTLSFVGCVLLTAAVVAVAGPIGFVGLIVPHAVRVISGPDQRVLLPASMLGAAALLAACDTVARTCIAPTEMPVGILTACIGAPVFLLLLLRHYAGRAAQ